MERPNIGRAILAGFAATVVMTMLMYGGPMMGMPKMDIAGMLGSVVGGWWMGMVAHFANGTIIFPLIYALLLYGILPGQPWLKGVQWGLALWFLAQVMVMPMMGMGFFSSKAPAPLLSVIGSLIGHFVYGAIFGAVTGEAVQAATQAEMARPLYKAG